MPTAPVPVEAAPPATKPEVPGKEQSAAAEPGSRWQKYVTPVLVVLLALAVVITVTPELEFLGGRTRRTGDRRCLCSRRSHTA